MGIINDFKNYWIKRKLKRELKKAWVNSEAIKHLLEILLDAGGELDEDTLVDLATASQKGLDFLKCGEDILKLAKNQTNIMENLVKACLESDLSPEKIQHFADQANHAGFSDALQRHNSAPNTSALSNSPAMEVLAYAGGATSLLSIGVGAATYYNATKNDATLIKEINNVSIEELESYAHFKYHNTPKPKKQIDLLSEYVSEKMRVKIRKPLRNMSIFATAGVALCVGTSLLLPGVNIGVAAGLIILGTCAAVTALGCGIGYYFANQHAKNKILKKLKSKKLQGVLKDHNYALKRQHFLKQQSEINTAFDNLLKTDNISDLQAYKGRLENIHSKLVAKHKSLLAHQPQTETLSKNWDQIENKIQSLIKTCDNSNSIDDATLQQDVMDIKLQIIDFKRDVITELGELESALQQQTPGNAKNKDYHKVLDRMNLRTVETAALAAFLRVSEVGIKLLPQTIGTGIALSSLSIASGVVLGLQASLEYRSSRLQRMAALEHHFSDMVSSVLKPADQSLVGAIKESGGVKDLFLNKIYAPKQYPPLPTDSPSALKNELAQRILDENARQEKIAGGKLTIMMGLSASAITYGIFSVLTAAAVAAPPVGIAIAAAVGVGLLCAGIAKWYSKKNEKQDAKHNAKVIKEQLFDEDDNSHSKLKRLVELSPELKESFDKALANESKNTPKPKTEPESKPITKPKPTLAINKYKDVVNFSNEDHNLQPFIKNETTTNVSEERPKAGVEVTIENQEQGINNDNSDDDKSKDSHHQTPKGK